MTGTIIDCHWPHQPERGRRMRCDSALTDAEILRRFGLEAGRAVVSVWPDGRPDQLREIYRPTINTDLPKGES